MRKIDLRSDTVTWPTAEMRKSMAEAEVGDDVYSDDPTINRLEALGAEMLGKESSVFVPSGTFGNQLALFTWCERGTEVIINEQNHIIVHEAGAASIIASVQTRPLAAPNGSLPVEAVEQRLRKRDLHTPPTSLICMENAHSLGHVVPLQNMQEIYSLSQNWGLPVHLDGARIFNAAAALGCDAKEIASNADSVMFCLSKGLCAPVGSLLAGPASFIEKARYKRKIMGGAMRQAGILAAAGIIALKESTKRLADDHKRARLLENALKKIPGIQVEHGDINMVFFSYEGAKKAGAGEAIVKQFADKGIVIGEPDKGLFRFVTHYWIGDAELEQVISVCREIFK
ncbi:MAG: low-specificity L-threonine aldolase [Spirochaetaceae bacterium]|jgi:threonine aldolase|nr:low-specificity L-threonine aldolase [Spirochaetaceae bacterium]